MPFAYYGIDFFTTTQKVLFSAKCILDCDGKQNNMHAAGRRAAAGRLRAAKLRRSLREAPGNEVSARAQSVWNPENFLLVSPASIVIYLTIEKFAC
jgi:hypothetical protein